jgi:iron-sulfur cluster assembly accessory protein
MTALDLTVTPAAAKFMRRIVRFAGQPAGAGFRLLVSAGGCSGYSTEFSAEAAPQDGDVALEIDADLRLFLPAESRLLLEGATLDFIDTPMQTGLSVSGGAGGGCGCAAPTAPTQATVSFDALRRR